LAEEPYPVTGLRISARARFWLLLLVFIQFFWFGANAGWAEDERISHLAAEVSPQGEILVSARLIQAIRGKIVNDIQHGIPKDLFYYILLMRRQAAWFDEELLDKTIKYTIQYDVLKKQYHVYIRDENGAKNQVIENFQEMVDLISKIDNVRIANIGMLIPKETYYVSVKAQMKVSRLPFYLKYLLFFIPVLELDTPWADSAPFYGGLARRDSR
jgi:Domain of unknown function (DUF4390)